MREPVAELDPRYSSEGATPTSWRDAVRQLDTAEVFWLSTRRGDGRLHVTPLLAVWHDDALHFCTGPDEQKAANLELDSHCALTTGGNSLADGVDIVVEGSAVVVRDEQLLRRLADAYESKYGPDWHFDVHDGCFHHDGGDAVVFAVAPSSMYAFAKGERFSHTRFQPRRPTSAVRAR